MREMREARGCELCGSPARVYCESDQASLCWNCDAKVHGANFLVARHPRTLLCRACLAFTPWQATGPKLGHTASLCDRCCASPRGGALKSRAAVVDPQEEIRADETNIANNGEIDAGEDYTDDEEEEDRDVVDDEEGEAENQVVPLPSTPPPAAASWSSDPEEGRDEESNLPIERRGRGSLKRSRSRSRSHSLDLNRCFQEEEEEEEDGTTSVDSARTLKDRRTESD